MFCDIYLKKRTKMSLYPFLGDYMTRTFSF